MVSRHRSKRRPFLSFLGRGLLYSSSAFTARMGLLISRAMDLLIGKQDRRILMLGTGTVGRPITAVLLIGCPCCYKLDAAGKTTILYSLHLGERITTIPTIGFNVEVCEYKSLRLTMWDVGGQERLRRLWRHYFDNTDALIFVVDASDRPRFEEAKQELMSLLSEEQLADAAVLIYCNKVDLPGTASASELVQTLEVDKLAGRHRAWYVQASCAATGEGLYEGLDWLSRQFKNRTQNGSRH